MKLKNMESKYMISLQLNDELLEMIEKVKEKMHLPITSVLVRMAIATFCEEKLREVNKNGSRK